jgi:hypothetical protein
VQDVSLDQRGEEVVCGSDGVDVAREVKVEVLHRNDLGVAAPGGAALQAEDRTERGLPQAEDGSLADDAETLGQRDGRRRLALAGLRRRKRCNADELPVGAILEPLEHPEIDLPLVAAMRCDLAWLEAQLLGDLADRSQLRGLGDLETGRHRRFGHVSDSQTTDPVSVSRP